MATIKTDNKFREVIYSHDLTEAERKDHDYLEDLDEGGYTFFRYKNWCYYLGNFMRITEKSGDLKDWDGYSSDTYFSGIVIAFSNDNDGVKVGTFYS